MGFRRRDAALLAATALVTLGAAFMLAQSTLSAHDRAGCDCAFDAAAASASAVTFTVRDARDLHVSDLTLHADDARLAFTPHAPAPGEWSARRGDVRLDAAATLAPGDVLDVSAPQSAGAAAVTLTHAPTGSALARVDI